MQKYLTGHSSLKATPANLLIALYMWLSPSKDTGGEWLPSEKAAREANVILAAIDGGNGQGTLI